MNLASALRAALPAEGRRLGREIPVLSVSKRNASRVIKTLGGISIVGAMPGVVAGQAKILKQD